MYQSPLFHSRNLRYLERVDLSGLCTDDLAEQLAASCPHLRHLAAGHSKQLTDAALDALTGAKRRRLNAPCFVPGCKKLKRLELHHCPMITASKIVSVLLTLPGLTFLSADKLSQVFESSALFESGLKFELSNFEHVVSHLERAREKINFHLRSEDQVRNVANQLNHPSLCSPPQFLLKVSEIFPRVTTVRLTLSHLYDDTSTLRQLANFNK